LVILCQLLPKVDYNASRFNLILVVSGLGVGNPGGTVFRGAMVLEATCNNKLLIEL